MSVIDRSSIMEYCKKFTLNLKARLQNFAVIIKKENVSTVKIKKTNTLVWLILKILFKSVEIFESIIRLSNVKIRRKNNRITTLKRRKIRVVLRNVPEF